MPAKAMAAADRVVVDNQQCTQSLQEVSKTAPNRLSKQAQASMAAVKLPCSPHAAGMRYTLRLLQQPMAIFVGYNT